MAYICSTCIGEPFLSRLVAASASSDNPCDYCERGLATVDTWFVAKKCVEVVESFYEPSSQTMAVLHFDREPAGDPLRAVVEDLVRGPEAAVEQIADEIDTMWFDRDSGEYTYGEEPWFVRTARMEAPMVQEWSAMESSLRHQARHVNPHVAAFMQSVFGGVASDRAADGTPVLRSAGPGTSMEALYRARVFQSEAALLDALRHPERLLGAPAPGVGPGGRMNSPGQPAFYGGTLMANVMAEVRPPVGSWVVVSRFTFIRGVTLLDLNVLAQIELPSGTSLFDPATKFAAQRRDFLQELAQRMIQPVMPEGQDWSYLITQVVADYLCMHPKANIDGIVYSSAQHGAGAGAARAENVVLFHKAAVCEAANHEGGTADASLWEFDEDGPGKRWNPMVHFFPDAPRHFFKPPGFRPDPALKLDRNSLVINRIRSVDIQFDPTPVSAIDSTHHD